MEWSEIQKLQPRSNHGHFGLHTVVTLSGRQVIVRAGKANVLRIPIIRGVDR